LRLYSTPRGRSALSPLLPHRRCPWPWGRCAAGVEVNARGEEPGAEGEQEASGELEAVSNESTDVRSSSKEAGGEDKEVKRKTMMRGTHALVCVERES